MVTIKIYGITQRVEEEIAHIIADKIEPNLRKGVPDRIRYYVDEQTGEVTYTTLTATQYCNMLRPQEEFEYIVGSYEKAAKLIYRRLRPKPEDAILAWQIVQTFDGVENPIVANRIGFDMVSILFPLHPAVISTHTNTEHIHNHIIISSWNLNGFKRRDFLEYYADIVDCTEQLCKNMGRHHQVMRE